MKKEILLSDATMPTVRATAPVDLPPTLAVKAEAPVDRTVLVNASPAIALAPAAAPGTFDVKRFVMRAMRGRWAFVIVVGLVTGGLAAWAGWNVGRPTYTSEGLIEFIKDAPVVD